MTESLKYEEGGSISDEISEDAAPTGGSAFGGDSFHRNVIDTIDESDEPADYDPDSVVLQTRSLPLKEQRYRLARYMLLLVAVLALVIFAAALAAPGEKFAQVKEMAPLIFSPLVTLLGTCIAWYYASNKNSE